MLYLCCTNLSITLVNPLFIGYSIAIYDNTLLVAVFLLDCQVYFSTKSKFNQFVQSRKLDVAVSVLNP